MDSDVFISLAKCSDVCVYKSQDVAPNDSLALRTTSVGANAWNVRIIETNYFSYQVPW